MNTSDFLNISSHLNASQVNNESLGEAPFLNRRFLRLINAYKGRLPYDLPLCVLSILLNCFLLLIFVKQKNFLKQFVLHFSLIIGDVLYAIGHFGIHVDRLTNGFDFALVTNYQCLLNQPMIILNLLGTQLVTWSNLCIGIDRMVAVVKPVWYRNNYRAMKQGIWATAIIWIAAASPLICMMLWSGRGGRQRVSFSCGEGTAPWPFYPTYNFSTNLVTSLLTVTMTSIALRRSKMPIPNMTPSQKNTHVRLTKISVVLAVKMIIFVAVPQLVLTVAVLLPRDMLIQTLGVISWFPMLYTFNGVLNFPTFWFINLDIRKVISTFFCGDKDQVIPVGPTGIPPPN